MRKFAPVLATLILVAILSAMMIAWLSLQPSWQISARNSSHGVIVEVYKSNATKPTYTTVIPGETIQSEIRRATRAELPADLVVTTFHDETIRPGRWTVVIDETELDIMEQALVVDGATQIAPRQ